MSRIAEIAAPNGPFVIGTRAVPSPGAGAARTRVGGSGTRHGALVRVRAVPTMADGPA